MFSVEPQEPWTAAEAAEFEKHVAKQLRKVVRDAVWAGGAFLLCILCIVLFATGHPLHRYWERTKFLIYVAEVLLVWFLIKAGFVWSAWQSARESRREFSGPL
jgi:protein-S-isoprenylcysteine O-methyltransferase Ste14